MRYIKYFEDHGIDYQLTKTISYSDGGMKLTLFNNNVEVATTNVSNVMKNGKFDIIKNKKYAVLWALLVDEEYRNKGIGKILIQKVIDYLKENTDIEVIILDVMHNNKYAIKLYTSLGFKEYNKYHQYGPVSMYLNIR